MSFRRRGTNVFVDTTTPAELDFQLYSVPDATIERIGRSLQRIPLSTADEAFGPMMCRIIDGFSCFFLVSQHQGDVVVVIVAVLPEDVRRRTDMKELIELAATFRGALGV